MSTFGGTVHRKRGLGWVINRCLPTKTNPKFENINFIILSFASGFLQIQYDSFENKFIVLNLKKQIEFKNMEDESNVNVCLVIGLVFNDKDKHMDNLMKLSLLLQNEEKLKEIKEAGTKDEVYKTLEMVFQK